MTDFVQTILQEISTLPKSRHPDVLAFIRYLVYRISCLLLIRGIQPVKLAFHFPNCQNALVKTPFYRTLRKLGDLGRFQKCLG